VITTDGLLNIFNKARYLLRQDYTIQGYFACVL
jgi:hypothetical protein